MKINTPTKEKPELTLKYDEPEVNTGEDRDIINLTGFIKTVSAVPTWTPRTFTEQFAIYKNATTYRFYWYDNENNEWRYSTGA